MHPGAGGIGQSDSPHERSATPKQPQRESGGKGPDRGSPRLPSLETSTGIVDRFKRLLIGGPRNLKDRRVYQHMSLVAFLAWVGLGADGLSSSCYGPAEAFVTLGEHTYLAVFLAIATILTVFVISTCYGHIIEEFPSGGGGYLVASKLLGPKVGVVSGSALLVDYILTITVSIAAMGEALFGLLGPQWTAWKLPVELAAITVLVVLNLRGVKESVMVLMPIFMVFLVTHIILIFGAVGLNLTQAATVTEQVTESLRTSLNNPSIGLWGMLALLIHAYSLGAGTYTGIEAVSNSMPVMREPRVETGKRTMTLMAVSLSLTAGGLMVAYLLLDIHHSETKTMNHLLTEAFVGEIGLGHAWMGMGFVLITVLSEAALLFVAAQAGFIDGPRILASMAIDSWMPHWFAHLSERLATDNGVMLMGVCAAAALIYTGGDVSALVVMYSINVFLTFSISMVGMWKYWFMAKDRPDVRPRRLALFSVGLVMCVSILVVTVKEKFFAGGWMTLIITGSFILVSSLIQRYYRRVVANFRQLDEVFARLPSLGEPADGAPNPEEPVAAILVGGYGGLGIHTLMNAIRFAPGYFKSVIFLSTGVVDSGTFKGAATRDDLQKHTAEALGKYVDVARRLGLPASSTMSIGTDAVDELEGLCTDIAKEYPKAIFFAGQIVFQQDSLFQRLLHNQTAFALLRRLQSVGLPIVILPTRVV